ncbi:integral membrane sensor signal transduction histidine kinase [Shewanella decolorationis S12]|uniref:Integral membrane sensor signal transduction histidine kinase n=1 Tax=Shewanella decolorationis S12 TaxID=1353536 RepID=A0ABP2Z5B9_9GAMM|nr:integral membrane sensor signal transduction histidine kinase [Shewanella decolorationis S12]
MSKRALAWQLLNSLKTRLVLSALLFILVLLPLIGVALNDAFAEQVKSAAKNELSAYVYSVLAVTEVENKRIFIPELVLENRFNLIQSGLYAIATTENAEHQQSIVWHSQSFMGITPPAQFTIPPTAKVPSIKSTSLARHTLSIALA